jgi:hypothetical protein
MSFFSNKWVKLGLFGFIGLIAGYAYYYYIGCNSGSCPITSNPYISSAYGLGAGLLLGWPGKKKENKEEMDVSR